MRTFIKRVGLFSIPLVLFVTLYVILDPFKVIRKYDIYLSDYVMVHRGFVSTKVYLRNREQYHFNSFIFGSSRSCAHTGQEWEKYLPDNDKSFSYSSWNEGINGICRKIELIDSLNDTIKNAFVLIDDKTFSYQSDDFLKMDHYLISGEKPLDFHFYYFSKYIDVRLFIASIDYRIFHKQRSYMYNYQGMKPGDLNPVNNDWYRDRVPPPDSIYSNTRKFYRRPDTQQYQPVNIRPDDLVTLQKIKSVFDKYNTDYKIVIAPLYDQLRINPADMKVLAEIFGAENIYDFSGINDITDNPVNYNADVLHYKYAVGDRIFKEIYSGQYCADSSGSEVRIVD